jgi:hypothetical protein
MWLCTSGDSACTFSRKQKTAARTAHQAIKQQPIEASPTLLVECNNQKKSTSAEEWQNTLAYLH